MSITLSIDKLAGEISGNCPSNAGEVESWLTGILEKSFEGLTAGEQFECLGKLSEKLQLRTAAGTDDVDPGTVDFPRLLSLLLGSKITSADLQDKEVMANFAGIMNTLFDSINQLIAALRTNLYGEDASLQTIRHIIGSNIEAGMPKASLKEYLAQIQNAFGAAHMSFQKAALKMVTEVLDELDPEKIANNSPAGLKFGPLRKAELYDAVKEKHRVCSQWVESGRFLESLVREFEKQCQANCTL